VASIDDLAHVIRPARGEPAGALVLMHGRGTSEHDLAPLLDEFDPEQRLVGLCPRGPLSMPPGGAHWYVVRQVGYPDPRTFLPTFELVSGWLDSLPDAVGVPIGKTVLGGFSQGTVMSYALGLGGGRPRPAGILGLSGFIPKVEGFEIDLSGLDDFPVAIGHGEYDPIISVEFGREARELLEGAGADVLYRESPMAHSVDPGFIPELRQWLEGVLP
jgi:phospholipase/carboxylesterase